ncbi:bone morphogenetic protein 15 [Entelurus aequoreus]|uniref:bone morphogenetic protein 15 n=1 Tax=Entelurus aequoreus TaxID=161455 RepID=UPI002B1DF67C|nr:bone morphogenetic protein 15 [Entelurus aequoreus]
MRGQQSFPRALVLSLLVISLWGVVVGSKMSAQSAHHRPLTDEQTADQNLQFMLSLYRSAARPDGRPKQNRKFGSNTVRLLKPSTSAVHYLPASTDHHYTFTVQYHLDTLPSEQLIRASFVHLRSSSSPASPNSDRAEVAPRCRVRIKSLGRESLVTMEPHQQWTETDITDHVLLGKEDGGGTVSLTAQYWCSEHRRFEDEGDGLSWGWASFLGGRKWRGESHLEAPSLLLYLEEERDGRDWMAELSGEKGDDLMKRLGRWHPFVRHRRSTESKDPLLDPLTTPTSASVISDLPKYKLKVSAPKNRCKLHSFRLSFDELGWGHYIAPLVYNPRFCQGDCPRVLTYGYHSPNHAIIQTIINELGVGDVPPPSCVPYKYMPMSVLVVHKKKVEYKELEDMVAKSCTCR